MSRRQTQDSKPSAGAMPPQTPPIQRSVVLRRSALKPATNGTLVGAPEVVTRGFVSKADEKLVAGAAARIASSIERPGEHFSEPGLLKAQIKDGLSNYLYEQTRRRPLVFPVIVEV